MRNALVDLHVDRLAWLRRSGDVVLEIGRDGLAERTQDGKTGTQERIKLRELAVRDGPVRVAMPGTWTAARRGRVAAHSASGPARAPNRGCVHPVLSGKTLRHGNRGWARLDVPRVTARELTQPLRARSAERRAKAEVRAERLRAQPPKAASMLATHYQARRVVPLWVPSQRDRQAPDGAYAAVIPKWIPVMIRNEPVYINGDGETSRDFCYIDNTIQANLPAATAMNPSATNQVYNVAVGDRTARRDLYFLLRANLAQRHDHLNNAQPIYHDFRAGDVRHALADIGKARKTLGYQPLHRIADGLHIAREWYTEHRYRMATQFQRRQRLPF